MPTKRKSTRKTTSKAVAKHAQSEQAVAPELKPLDIHEQLFVDHYFLSHMNQTEAAMQAYAPKTRNTARAIGCQVMARPHVRAAVVAKLNEFHMSRDEVLARYAFIARGSMEDFLNLDSDTITIDVKKAKQAEALGLLKKVKVRHITTDDTETEEIEIEMHDPLGALGPLGRTLHLFDERTEVYKEEHVYLHLSRAPQQLVANNEPNTVDAEIVSGDA